MTEFNAASLTPKADAAAPPGDRRPARRARAALAWRLCFGAVASAAFVAIAAASERQALWQVVRACVADYRLSGSPFPCLAVDLAGGEDRGDVVLRRPLGRPDTILAPTRKIVGLEDPWLQSPQAPNYFAAALDARAFVAGADGTALKLDEAALAVNSRFARTQDQLHIHIGCLSARARRMLDASVAELKLRAWGRVGALAPETAFWGWRTGQANLDGVEPFRLAAERAPGKSADLGRLMIVVAGARITGRDELVVLAADVGPPAPRGLTSAEEILDMNCSDSARSSDAD
jgi:CDP-diacylglycerol pyrophosphatase